MRQLTARVCIPHLSSSCLCSLLPVCTVLECLVKEKASCFFPEVSGSRPVADQGISNLETEAAGPDGGDTAAGGPDGGDGAACCTGSASSRLVRRICQRWPGTILLTGRSVRGHVHVRCAGRGVNRWPAASGKGCHRSARGSPQEGPARIRPGAAAGDRRRHSNHLAKMPLHPRLRDQSTEPGASVLLLGGTASH